MIQFLFREYLKIYAAWRAAIDLLPARAWVTLFLISRDADLSISAVPIAQIRTLDVI